MTDSEIESQRSDSEVRRAEIVAELGETARLLERLRAEEARLYARRLAGWRAAREVGLSWREIGRASGLDHAQIAKAVRAKRSEVRRPERGEGIVSRYSLNRPHPEHVPDVGREFLGTTWNNGRRYGTTLRCSCGWRPERVSNEPPSGGGRVDALRVYREHLAEEEEG